MFRKAFLPIKRFFGPVTILGKMQPFCGFANLLIRYRYPVSTPEDVAIDLGLECSNNQTFHEFINHFTLPCCKPKNLLRFMDRADAEDMFRKAKKKEYFKNDSLFSYYFNGSWLEFILQYDDRSRLRRVYIQHKDLKQKYEIPISQ